MRQNFYNLIFFVLPLVPFLIIAIRKLNGRATKLSSAARIGLFFLFLLWAFNLVVYYVTFVLKD